MQTKIGVICFTWALIFQLSQTSYFGNNWIPQTKEEVMCDITSLLMVLCAYYLMKEK